MYIFHVIVLSFLKEGFCFKACIFQIPSKCKIKHVYPFTWRHTANHTLESCFNFEIFMTMPVFGRNIIIYLKCSIDTLSAIKMTTLFNPDPFLIHAINKS